MSNDNGQVAHLWANRSKAHARSSNGNFHFDGDTIYSYATPIAKLYPRCTLITSTRYSTTTEGKHKNAIRRAVEGARFCVPSIGSRGGRNYDDKDGKPDHAANLKHFQESFDSAVNTWRLARDNYRVDHASEHAASLADIMLEYAMCFGLKAKAWRKPHDTFHNTRDSVLAERAAREAKNNTPAAIAKRAKEQARRDAKRQRAFELAQAAEAEKAQAWINGEFDHYRTPYGLPAVLRVKGNTLQTSQGASVPLDHAIRAFRFILAVRQKGEPWETNGHRLPVGNFQVDRIEPTGDIKAGCHRIEWPEIARVARQLELIPA